MYIPVFLIQMHCIMKYVVFKMKCDVIFNLIVNCHVIQLRLRYDNKTN